MATPTPEGEAFAESADEAVQTAVMAVRLVMAIADAVRRHQQRQKAGAERELPPAAQAVGDASAELRNLWPPDISAALTGSADWPQMAQQLMALKQAGVDLDDLLPRVGEIAVTVRDAVAANVERVAREGTGEWERMLRETLPAGPVREALLSSPTWPDIAATMARLDERGVDVREVLASAHDEGLGVDQAVAKVLAAAAAPTTSRDAMLAYGPLTTGLDIPRDLDLADQRRALRQLAISSQENERFMRLVREAMPGREREADPMFTARQWPLVTARMAKMESEGTPVTPHLARLMKDTSWEKGPDAQLGSRLVRATTDALCKPLGAGTQVKASTAAARVRSSTAVPARPQASKGAAPAEPTVAAHRAAGPAAMRGKAR